MLKIMRYRQKRDLRNFNRTVKYQCRKSLADMRPRVKGRFARNDDPALGPGDGSGGGCEMPPMPAFMGGASFQNTMRMLGAGLPMGSAAAMEASLVPAHEMRPMPMPPPHLHPGMPPPHLPPAQRGSNGPGCVGLSFSATPLHNGGAGAACAAGGGHRAAGADAAAGGSAVSLGSPSPANSVPTGLGVGAGVGLGIGLGASPPGSLPWNDPFMAFRPTPTIFSAAAAVGGSKVASQAGSGGAPLGSDSNSHASPSLSGEPTSSVSH
jgi:hypothetical protein